MSCVASGHIYGPPKGKMMHLFVDDLHLPVIQDDGTGLGNVSEVCAVCIRVCVCVCACVCPCVRACMHACTCVETESGIKSCLS